MRIVGIGLAAALLAIGGGAAAQSKQQVVSTGNRFEVANVLADEGTTVVVFMQRTSVMELQFLAGLERQVPFGPKVLLDVVKLKDLAAPAAQQYGIQTTPTAIVYDRFGHEIGRSSDTEQIKAAVRKGRLMGRIKWIDEDDPTAPQVYGAPPEALKRGLAGIVKTMALRPEAYKMFNIMSDIHFSDGFLKRREHEMVGAYVSALNKCRF